MRRLVLPLARRRQRGGVNPQVTIGAAHGFHQEEGQDVLLQKRAAPGTVGVRTAAVRTVKTASKHD